MSAERKRILVTGAASGMGFATAERLLSNGFDVILLDRVGGPLRDLVAKHGSGTVMELDMLQLDTLREKIRRLDNLVGIANIAGLGPDHANPAEVMIVNYVAPSVIMQEAHERLLPGSGVVNVVSMIAHVVDDDKFDDLMRDPFGTELIERAGREIATGADAYIYAKRGLLHRSKRLAIEWAPDVRVNTVSPGFIDTPMTTRGAAFDEWTRKNVARIPLGRLGQPSEVGSVIAFLLSDAASYLNGVDVPIDGGSLASRQMHLLERARG